MSRTEVVIDANKTLGACPHFWTGAGDDDAYDWTFKPAGAALLAEIKRTGAIKWFRNHHALSKIVTVPGCAPVQAYTEDAAGNPIYNFSGMDAVYDRWLAAGIRPYVELDYIPEALQTPERQEIPRDWKKWGALLRAYVRHLQERYGVEETRQWYFENYNEPEHKFRREHIEDFFRLHDEFIAAIEDVDPKLRAGGPGTYTDYFTGAFMHHITHGRNKLTGKTGSRADFISSHSYAVSGNTMAYFPLMQPRTQDILNNIYWMYQLNGNYPGMREREYHLNEWGIVSHYQKTRMQFPPLELRDSEFAPLFMLKLVHKLFSLADNRGNFLPKLMLLWAGAYEADIAMFAGCRSLITKHSILKPIFRAFELLTHAGDSRLGVYGAPAGLDTSVFATHGNGAVQLLAYQFIEQNDASVGDATVKLDLRGLSTDGPALAEVLRIDRVNANSYRAWERMGRPEDPTGAEIERLKAASELKVCDQIRLDVRGGRTSLKVNLPGQAAALVRVRPVKGEFAGPKEKIAIAELQQEPA